MGVADSISLHPNQANMANLEVPGNQVQIQIQGSDGETLEAEPPKSILKDSRRQSKVSFNEDVEKFDEIKRSPSITSDVVPRDHKGTDQRQQTDIFGRRSSGPQRETHHDVQQRNRSGRYLQGAGKTEQYSGDRLQRERKMRAIHPPRGRQRGLRLSEVQQHRVSRKQGLQVQQSQAEQDKTCSSSFGSHARHRTHKRCFQQIPRCEDGHLLRKSRYYDGES